jgi:hypothetical protein
MVERLTALDASFLFWRGVTPPCTSGACSSSRPPKDGLSAIDLGQVRLDVAPDAAAPGPEDRDVDVLADLIEQEVAALVQAAG